MDAGQAHDGGASDAADEPDAELSVRELIDLGIGLLEHVGDIVQANINDCDAMADSVAKYRDENRARLRETDKIYLTENHDELERLTPQFHARYQAAWKRIRPGIIKCKNKPRMREVLSAIAGDNNFDAGM